MPTSKTLLDVRAVSKRYGTNPILREISLSLAPGERVALMGPSGAGKSTLLNCIGGIEKIDSGEIRFGDHRIDELAESTMAELRRREIGSIFQFFHLLPTLSAFENIELPLMLLGHSRKQRALRTRELLDEVGVAHRAEGRPSELSGGEQQRVAIARALATEPRLILADEPTGNLDSSHGERILNLIERMSEAHGFALIMVTHQPETTRICQRTIQLRDGRIETLVTA